MAGKKTYPASPTGYWRVTLSASWEDQGFLFKPAYDVTLDEDTLKRAIAADRVKNVVAAT